MCSETEHVSSHVYAQNCHACHEHPGCSVIQKVLYLFVLYGHLDMGISLIGAVPIFLSLSHTHNSEKHKHILKHTHKDTKKHMHTDTKHCRNGLTHPSPPHTHTHTHTHKLVHSNCI